ncbi:MAG: DUF1178 family protein [Proteobacteria bacterium]|jgi:hypothetical protein|nr:DUF1178 family protein [Pseudomonadota bacterium]
MIKYELRCHDCDQTFEGWFVDSAAYDKQARKGDIVCPFCSGVHVGKAIMAPNIAVKGSKRKELSAAQFQAEARKFLMGVRKEVEANCDYVGPQFADEARKIHKGEAKERGIYGEATKKERDALEEDGIEAVAIPWVSASDA